MKKCGILNSDIARVLAYMGHTDRLCIGDCGLPIPETTERIDLAVRFGVPSFMEVVNEVAADMKVEKIILAEEIKEMNPQVEQRVLEVFGDIEVEYVTHVELKALSADCKAVIRTGETTPYANVILQSGCIFG